jgi:DNA-binding PadR family transcriptional regulator
VAEELTKGMLSFLILTIMKKKPRKGPQISRALAKMRGRKPAPGTLYPALIRLEEEGIVRSKKDGRVNIYWLTAKGKRTQARAWRGFRKILTNLKKFI